MAKNTTTYGATYTSLGDGSDQGFWRQGQGWYSGATSGTGISISTTFSTNWLTQVSVTGGFVQYLIQFSFSQAGVTAPSSNGVQILAGVGVTSSTQFFSNAVGYMSTSGTATYSGTTIYTAPSYQPFTLYLFARTNTGTATVSLGSITAIGIN
jgi:hypothetical protein